MNTNNLKKFAQQARRKLLEQIAARMEHVLHTDSAELREKAAALHNLQEAINTSTKEQVIYKVAYTWFNRLMALRFMDDNDYQPIGLRVVTPKDGHTLPEILDEAKQGNIPDELPVNQQHIYDLLDGKIPAANPQNEAYKELLIGACNHLNKVFPFLFERIDDYTELLLPDDLTSEFSIVNDMREGMTEEDCREVEIIGWLYQFYISEKKDEVFASKSKVKKEDIPAATQLFTPRWIVEYMVQNTVGKLWLQNKPNSRLREHMPYFIESASVSPSGEMSEGQRGDYLKINSVEEITLLDQACGSGHILVYAFELFTKIYEEEGYNPGEIPQLIIEKNLYGFEIDERAAQLAGFALMMKARKYQRRVFRKQLKPNILCFQDLLLNNEEIKETFQQTGIHLYDELSHDLTNMQQATNFGSLIIPHSATHELETTLEKVNNKVNTADAFLNHNLRQLKEAMEQLLKLGKKYQCLVTNPPYLGSRKMNINLLNWLKSESYTDVSRDLYSSFIKRSLSFIIKKGLAGMITQISWMFTVDFKEFRASFLSNYSIINSLILGSGAFETISGEVVKSCVFVMSNIPSFNKSVFIDLVSIRDKSNSLGLARHYLTNIKDFKQLKQKQFAYKLSSLSISKIAKSEDLSSILDVKQGLATGSNDRFLRYSWEVSNDIFRTLSDSYDNNYKWYPYDKGGGYKKYYGNDLFIINWENNGYEIKNFKDDNGKLRSRPQNEAFYFRNGMTFNLTGKISFRYKEIGHIFDVQGSSSFLTIQSDQNLYYFAGFLNSKLTPFFTDLTNPTMVTQVGDISKIPFVVDVDRLKEITNNAKQCIQVSKDDWNKQIISWNFLYNELIHISGQNIEETYSLYRQYWQNQFYQLHRNEEELNARFIEIYGLQEELTPDVPLADITILKDELDQKKLKEISDNYRSGWQLTNGEWNLQPAARNPQPVLPFNAKEVMAQFI